jgi:hypothetical protein
MRPDGGPEPLVVREDLTLGSPVNFRMRRDPTTIQRSASFRAAWERCISPTPNLKKYIDGCVVVQKQPVLWLSAWLNPSHLRSCMATELRTTSGLR